MTKVRRNAVQALIDAATTLRDEVDALRFADPVTHVYNPLAYAWPVHEAYLRCHDPGRIETVWLGMNPGPWGMAQTGVPFGEVAAVREFWRLDGTIGRPAEENPKRPVAGWECERSEVSGRRLWGLIREQFGDRETAGSTALVANYCPLVFMESSGRNRTPDKLPADERAPLDAACDRHLARVLEIVAPRDVVGVGVYAEKKLAGVWTGTVNRVLHPSPASPAANRDWAGTARGQLVAAGIW